MTDSTDFCHHLSPSSQNCHSQLHIHVPKLLLPHTLYPIQSQSLSTILAPNLSSPQCCEEVWSEAVVAATWCSWLWLVAGTHDSFTFHLDECGSVATGAPGAVQGLATVFGSLAKKIISNWSKTQSLGVDAQLKAGVRYFDIRVSGRPGSSELFIVHGLYGPTVESCMESLATFLDEHCCEIVLLDFNHFYDMDSAAHDRLIKALIDRLVSLFSAVYLVLTVKVSCVWATVFFT